MKASLLCLLLLALFGASSAKKIPRWWMKVAQRQGPNACVVEEIPNTNIEFYTECKYWLRRNICGRRTVIRFDCCEGFEQIEGEDGCTRVKALRNVLETAESLGATKWAEYIRESGLAPELTSAGAFTLFVPTNDAFDKIRRSLKGQMDAYRGNPENPIVLYHMVPNKIISDDFGANVMVETRNQGANIRINKYSNGMTTINCALLIRKDQQATNGVVHIIDSILDPSVGIVSNVADMILSDGRFSVMAEILEKSGYVNVLRTMQDSISILAPSDEAFQKIPESRRDKIINDREARLALLQNHIIPHVICESAITGEHRVRTVSENKLTFNCDIEGAYVENTKLRNNFNLGKNGIIHMIDDVLLPDRAKNLIELAESRQLVTFVDMVRKAGLEETLAHTGDYTFFVPSELAWLEMDESIMARARKDVEFAGALIRFHGAYGRHLTNAITDNQAIMSLDEENPVRLQVWRKALGVEDAKIEEQDLEAQNGVIHIINKVIVPSNQTAADILRNIKGKSFNTFLEAMEKVTSKTNLLSLKPGDSTFYTFFVPPDSAFRALDQAHLSQMMSDSSVVESVIKNHIAINMFPETSFVPGLIYTVNGMAGPFDVKKGTDGVLTVNGAKVSSSHMSANGVIHITDRVFMPEESSYTNSASGSSRSSSSSGSSSSSSWSSSSSSSSSSSRRFTRKLNKSSRRRVNYDQDGDFDDDILPAYPQGSVEGKPSRATRRKTSRWSLRRKASGASPLPSAVTTTTTTSTSALSSATAKHGGRGGSSIGSNNVALEENLTSTGVSAAREVEINKKSIDTSSIDNHGSHDSHGSSSKGTESSSTSYSISENVISGVGLHDSSSSINTATSNIDNKDYSEEIVDDSSRSVTYSDKRNGVKLGSSISEDQYSTGAEANLRESSGSSVSYLEDRYISGIDADLQGIVIGDNTDDQYIEGRYKAGNDADLSGSSISSNLNTNYKYNAGIDADLQGTVISTKIQEDRYKAGIDADLHGSSSVTRDRTYKAGINTNTQGSHGSEGRYRSGIEGDLRKSFERKWRAGIDADLRGSSNSESNRSEFDYDHSGSTSEDRYRAGIDADLHGSSHYSLHSSSDLSSNSISPSISSGASGYNSRTETRYISGGSLGQGESGAKNLGSSSRNYTYTYSKEGTGGTGRIQTGGGSLTHDGSNLPILTGQSTGLKTTVLTSSTHKNTVGPISPDGEKFSYVGHPYGKDIVGHGDNSMPLPIISGSSVSNSESRGYKTSSNNNFKTEDRGLGHSYNYEHSYDVDFSGPRRGDTAVGTNENSGSDSSYSSSSRSYSGRGSSTGIRKQYGITASTVVTGPEANSKAILRKTERKYTFPLAEGIMPVTHLGMDGKPHSSLVSAYAFTGRETEYADGSEFLEATAPKETVITAEEAIRKRWRRKRHHRRGGRRRAGRGRAMRRQARRRQNKSKE